MDKALVDIARGSIGVRFVPQGRDLAGGGDCVGLITASLLRRGHSVRDCTETDWGTDGWGIKMLSYVEEQCTPVDISAAEPGDILLFWIRSKREPRHMAIISEADGGAISIVHAPGLGSGVVSEIKLDERWLKRIHSCWRYKEEAS